MTTAYALQEPKGSRPQHRPRSPSIRMTGSASGPEARSLFEDVRERLFGPHQTPRGTSAVSTSVTLNAVQLVRISDDQLEVISQSGDDSYIPPIAQPVFTVKATIQHAGKLKPRKFNFDE